ncbi:hypothetical protein GCM10029992_47430 [Glycomyces albus]
MRAFVLTGPREYSIQDVPEPDPIRGEAVVEVERVGVCGTDVEFYTGGMQYLHDGHSAYPMRLGHEWAGRVTVVGEGVDPAWIGRRVMGDTMLGDGTCRRCRRGLQHVCERRQEVGIRGGRHGALAERLAVPASSLHALPEAVGAELGALVEPGGNALRAVQGPTRAPATGSWCSDRAPSGCWRPCSPARPAPKYTCWASPKARSSSPPDSASSTLGPR